jgi:tetratricopeptide (TPR) repeat protein
MEDYDQIKDLIKSEVKNEIENRKRYSINFLIQLFGINFALITILFGVFTFFGVDYFNRKFEESVADKIADTRKSERLYLVSSIDSLVQKNIEIEKEIKEMYLSIKNKSQNWDENVRKAINEKLDSKIDKESYQFYLEKGIEEYNKRNKEAISSFERALKYNSDEFDVFYKLAIAYMDLEKDKANTINSLKKSVENGLKDKEKAIQDGFEIFLGKATLDEVFSNSEINTIIFEKE